MSTYNRPERLKKAIESVQKQTFEDWELIVVHDGPINANTAFDDDRFREAVLDEHFGTDTRPKNEGIKAAKADLIAFLDDDNTWRPDHLQALYTALKDKPELAGVYGDRWVTDEEGQIPSQIGKFRDWSPYHLMTSNYIDTSDVLIRKHVLEYLGGFDERYRKFVDWNLWVRLAKAGFEMQRVPQILTDRVIHAGSKSRRKEDEAAPLTPAWKPSDLEIRVPFLGPVEPPKVAIFSLTMNRLEMTKQCFKTLWETAGYDFVHFVVDNGSTDGTAEWLKKEYAEAHYQKFIAIYNKENRGISAASNQAVDDLTSFQRPDIIVKVDPDAFFLTPGWLKTMVDLWERNHLLALSPAVQGLKDNPGGASREAYGLVNNEYLGLTRHLGGICVFADARAYQHFRWNENDFLHAAQDVEFSQHLLKNGYQPAYLENYYVSHGPEGTEAQEQQYPEYFQKRKEEKRTRYAKAKS